MSTKSDQLDNLVARLQPVRDEDLVSESRSRDAEALFEQIVTDFDGDADCSAPSGHRSRDSRRWLIPAVALATAGVVVAIIAIGVGPTTETVTPAAAALREAADAARAQDEIPPGSYVYVRSVNANLTFGSVLVDPSDPEAPTLECCEAFVPHVREMWLGDEPGDARLRERKAGAPQFLSDEERERWIGLGQPELEAKTPFSGILVGLPARGWYDGPLDLPSDADAIYEQFERDAEADHSAPGAPVDVDVGGSMFLHFSDVLREARTTPEQRAAAYEALARVPGVILVGETSDRFGRRGVGVGIDIVDNEPSGFLFRHVLVFDPETADLLEERREVLPGNRHRGLPAGMIEAYATYEYAVVGALGERPATHG
ncbi:MAG: CU044_5270 family protein [Gaiellaceae bacterium]